MKSMNIVEKLGKEKFLSIFNSWLTKHRHDGNFYKGENGWFILEGAKKRYMPSYFQDYQTQLFKKDANPK